MSSVRSVGRRGSSTARPGTASGRTISTAVAATARSVRPATGLSRSTTSKQCRPTTGVAPERIVESPAYYASMISAKIEEISAEIQRLRSETEMMDGQSEPRRALDARHRELKETVKRLKDELRDHNLAKENARMGANHEDVRKLTAEIVEHNGKLEREIDRMFFSRKRTEDDIKKVELETVRIHAKMEARIIEEGNGEDEANDRVGDYRMFVEEIEFLQEEAAMSEEELEHENRLAETKPNDYRDAKILVDDLRESLERVEEEILLTGMSERDARDHLTRKIGKAERQSVMIEAETSTLRAELDELAQRKKELTNELRLKSIGGGQGIAGACDRLARKERFFLKYLEDAPSLRAKLQEEKDGVRSRIDLISRQSNMYTRVDGTVILPSREELELMKNDVAFATKNLDESRRTISLLEGQKERRAAEVSSRRLVFGYLRASFQKSRSVALQVGESRGANRPGTGRPARSY